MKKRQSVDQKQKRINNYCTAKNKRIWILWTNVEINTYMTNCKRYDKEKQDLRETMQEAGLKMTIQGEMTWKIYRSLINYPSLTSDDVPKVLKIVSSRRPVSTWSLTLRHVSFESCDLVQLRPRIWHFYWFNYDSLAWSFTAVDHFVFVFFNSYINFFLLFHTTLYMYLLFNKKKKIHTKTFGLHLWTQFIS